MQSVISFENRGPWGDSRYRGNCSGHVIRELISQFGLDKMSKALFVDACEGSGTSGDVCKEYPNIEYVGLDLKSGNDYTRNLITDFLPRHANMCFSHPSYHNMIQFSGNMWGKEKHPDDHSCCASPEEFLAKSQVMLLNQREATQKGGIYATLIGDHRKSGQFRSYQADFISMMPKSELKSIVIKMQHNCVSDSRQYRQMKFPSIQHEYLIIWEKAANSMVDVIWEIAQCQKRQVNASWRSLVRIAMMNVKKGSLNEIYTQVEQVAGKRMDGMKDWKATVRRTLQQHHKAVERGVWAMA